jgi:hypothetical protein
MLQTLLDDRKRLQGVVDYMRRNAQVQDQDVREIRALLGDVQRAMEQQLTDARRHRTPPLTNIAPGSSLQELLAARSETPLVGLYAQEISRDWVAELGLRLEALLGRVQRVHGKSLGGLLACQEWLAREWADRPTANVALSFAPTVAAGPTVV